MTSMIERIVTILNTTPDEYGSEYVARKILEGMREPTPAMSDALDTRELHAGWLYTKAIDAALLEQQP